MHIGQAVITSAVTVCEPGVIEAEQLENGGVKIVNMNAVFCNCCANLVGAAIREPALRAGAGEP